jgi:ATP-binding cassette subfamily F protein 3
MVLLLLDGVRKHYGAQAVLDGVAGQVRPGERIGLVGPNGAGKSTLLRIIAGQESLDAGVCQLRETARLAYLEQHPSFDPGKSLWQEAESALNHLKQLADQAEQVARNLARALDPADHARLAARYDRLQHELHQRAAYNLDHKIERVLDGLGFDRAAHARPVASLSGGQLNRLMLAKLLLADADLLLLDEPSNHLDIEATAWLEEFLTSSPSAMIIVSHDRYLLDKVTNRTWELFRGTVDSYAGNFSAYWRQKVQRLETQRRAYEKQQAFIAKTEDFIRRNQYGQKHAQAKDREKKLARVERVEPPRRIEAPALGFRAAARSGDIVVRVEGISKSYGRTLFSGLSWDILRGQRWGILGPNGCGKTTLLRCLVGDERPDTGRVVVGAEVRVGYCDQQLAALPGDMPVVDAVRPVGRETTQAQRRDLLARFGLTGEMVFQPVNRLSGGERSRAALARLAAAEANFLVLDEPTNHLDLWARDALERSLLEFEGTVLFVSHDRYFLNRVADHLLVMEQGNVRWIEGNFDTYAHLVQRAWEPDQSKRQASAAANRGAKGTSAAKPAPRKRKFPYRKVADIEAEIAERESRIESLQASLADPEVYRSGQRIRQVRAEIDQQQSALAGLYDHWLEASEWNG